METAYARSQQPPKHIQWIRHKILLLLIVGVTKSPVPDTSTEDLVSIIGSENIIACLDDAPARFTIENSPEILRSLEAVLAPKILTYLFKFYIHSNVWGTLDVEARTDGPSPEAMMLDKATSLVDDLLRLNMWPKKNFSTILGPHQDYGKNFNRLKKKSVRWGGDGTGGEV
uniref:Uncharacterized protein n=1 Tax=Romanomermis culicivorax TaxID=13658 RepID=A0A915L416_ROMCU